MTPPTGYVEAEWVGGGVVKLPDLHTTSNVLIPGCICGPGDTAVITRGEAETSDNWKIVGASPPVAPPLVVPPKNPDKEGSD